MYHAKVNQKFTVELSKDDSGNPIIPGDSSTFDWAETSEGKFHVLLEGKSYHAELLSKNFSNKTVSFLELSS